MKKIYEYNGFSFHEYNPTIFRPFYVNLEPISMRKRLRFLLAYFAGYKVYYMAKDDEYIGYCVVENGRDIRYKFATNKDILVGPYFVKEDYRGRKLSVMLLEVILHNIGLRYNYAWDYIKKTNIPSIKASSKVGLSYFSDATISSITRQLVLLQDNKGDYCIMRYKNIKA
ncbi:hypothetical protein [Sedimentibacter saalensis]|uniref:Acetyltransferase (GNAT) family protein n=1 Tax=Sedimentibacter saalensis TaxID=130788 RepID=A0A562J8K1_9FIRM|nr:hypothetical protein [Sedimentibacter saalensis]TWH79373.1 hypothetical protein LY60_02351 [Sedimentibacter saalensis]